jgi:hypothetical protein
MRVVRNVVQFKGKFVRGFEIPFLHLKVVKMHRLSGNGYSIWHRRTEIGQTALPLHEENRTGVDAMIWDHDSQMHYCVGTFANHKEAAEAVYREWKLPLMERGYMRAVRAEQLRKRGGVTLRLVEL